MPTGITITGITGALGFFDGGAGIGQSPIITWSAPLVGVPDVYCLTGYTLSVQANGVTRYDKAWTIYTPFTRVKMVPGALQLGKTYVFTLAAQKKAHLAAPFRTGLGDFSASTPSGMFTPGSCSAGLPSTCPPNLTCNPGSGACVAPSGNGFAGTWSGVGCGSYWVTLTAACDGTVHYDDGCGATGAHGVGTITPDGVYNLSGTACSSTAPFSHRGTWALTGADSMWAQADLYFQGSWTPSGGLACTFTRTAPATCP